MAKGLSKFTMEALATEAGVSNPLVYKYFDTRLELLQELLTREFDRFYKTIKDQLHDARDFRDVVRAVVSVNFDEYSSGDIVNILRNQADVRAALFDVEEEQVGQFLVAQLAETYDISPEKAAHLAVLGSGASQRAADKYAREGGDREQMIEQVVTYIFGGIEIFQVAK